MAHPAVEFVSSYSPRCYRTRSSDPNNSCTFLTEIACLSSWLQVEEGTPLAEARAKIWVLDDKGLLGAERDRGNLSTQQAALSRESDEDAATGVRVRDRATLLQVVSAVRPTVLLGLSGAGGTFTEDVVREMAKHTKHPIIFPLSNPTTRAECTLRQAAEWTNGAAIFASGSPFEPVEVNGRTVTASQSNNFMVFPGIGLMATALRPKCITNRMFYAAARAVADMVSDADAARGCVLPPVSAIREVSAHVAAAAGASAIADGLARRLPSAGARDLVAFMHAQQWEPIYRPLLNDVY